jgi:uncharacterized protein YbjT (DUF2867 family)
MKIAITGGTGFVGRHLARELVGQGHEVVLLARGVDERDPSVREMPRTTFVASDLGSVETLAAAFQDCDAVAHLAGINREIGVQTYQKVHIDATSNVVEASRRAGVNKIALLSFLRARPDCGSAYHESKWAAEEIVRGSGLDYTIVKAGVTYGRGDHLLDHLSAAFKTFYHLPVVGYRLPPMRPVAVEDVVRILVASLVEGRLSRETVAAVGPEEMKLSELARRVASAMRTPVWIFRSPVALHQALAFVFERTMKVPLASFAQVRILTETLAEPLPGESLPPEDLRPRTLFSPEQIQKGLPEKVHRFGLKDCLHSR